MAKTTTVPLVGSGTKGPLGAVQLPRLWQKLSLASHGQLPDDYDECGPGFDQMTLTALGLDRAETIEYIRSNHPTYMEFEDWVTQKNGGVVDPERIRKHNEAVHAYCHGDETASNMRKSAGIRDRSVRDAVTLNAVEDLDGFHRQLHGRD